MRLEPAAGAEVDAVAEHDLRAPRDPDRDVAPQRDAPLDAQVPPRPQAQEGEPRRAEASRLEGSRRRRRWGGTRAATLHRRAAGTYAARMLPEWPEGTVASSPPAPVRRTRSRSRPRCAAVRRRFTWRSACAASRWRGCARTRAARSTDPGRRRRRHRARHRGRGRGERPRRLRPARCRVGPGPRPADLRARGRRALALDRRRGGGGRRGGPRRPPWPPLGRACPQHAVAHAAVGDLPAPGHRLGRVVDRLAPPSHQRAQHAAALARRGRVLAGALVGDELVVLPAPAALATCVSAASGCSSTA